MEETIPAPRTPTIWSSKPPGAPPAVSDTPVYDALERQWRREGREVPRPPAPQGWTRTEPTDLFRRT
ncbi:hypothetical protein [Streptomyces sp. NPDC051211]|uniref:hypothetical protein n=1 Tax=Streptomyces sp. NPDC051211 TaxID=3154643 RepID=UPI00344E17D6